MTAKRVAAGSPAATAPKPKKAKATKAAAAAAAMSRNASSTHPNTPVASASSPPLYSVDSPAGTLGGRRTSRSRSRSVSVVPGAAGGTKGKGKEDVGAPAPAGGQDGAHDGEGDPEADGEDEDEQAYSDDEFGNNQKDYARQKEDLRVLLEHFDPSQMDRYESYRRSGLNKASVRKLVNAVLQQSVGPSILTVVRGFAKVFVGEIVEIARRNSQHEGPLSPADIREAFRVYQDSHRAANRKKLFTR